MAKRTLLTIDNLFVFKTSPFIILLPLVYFSSGDVSGTVTLSPGGVVQVCQAGDPLELTCSTNRTIIRWSFTVRNGLQGYGPTFIYSEDESQQMSEIIVNSTTFTIIRISAKDSSPLTSMLSINSVNRELNGTVVYCENVDNSMTASTTIYFIDKTSLGPIMVRTSEEYRGDSIRVRVEWIQEEGVSYNITIVPIVPQIVRFTGNASVQLRVLYNIEYNMSLEAFAVCQSAVSSHVQLFYANCGNFQLSAIDSNNLSVTYSGLPIEGTTASFSCSPGMVLNGTNKTTCTENGEWKPDLLDVHCVEGNCGRLMTDSLVQVVGYDNDDDLPADIGTTVNFTCPPDMSLIGRNSTTCTKNGKWMPDPSDLMCTKGKIGEALSQEGKIAVASSMTVFVAASILFFTVGFLCGHFCKKKRKSAVETVPPASSGQTQIPYYDDVVLKQEVQLELKENIAYGPIR